MRGEHFNINGRVPGSVPAPGELEVHGMTIYLDGRPVAVFLPGLSEAERVAAEEALGLRLPLGR